MTTEELKKKIDGLFFGLHSTNPGDINAIKDILNEVNPWGDVEIGEEIENKEFYNLYNKTIIDIPGYDTFFRAAGVPTAVRDDIMSNLPDNAEILAYYFSSNTLFEANGVAQGAYLVLYVAGGKHYSFSSEV